MLANELEVIVYPRATYAWHSQVTANPTWAQIQVAVRKLDRAEYPFLHIYIPQRSRESELQLLNVIGGAGEYGMSGHDGRWHSRWRFRDPNRPRDPELIDIWVTDQGAACEETYLCNDLSLVLRVCKRFAELGELDAGVVWEERPN